LSLDLSSFEKVIASLNTALDVYTATQHSAGSSEHELMRDGVIQRFKYTFELAWKMIKRYLQEYGLERVDSLTNRDLFRLGYEQGLVREAEIWFDYLTKRNLTSHTYNQVTAEAVYQSAQAFLYDARFLLDQLRNKAQ
jgi:nucleotidyltransferase substrate binding protein (TIGR01987 family)